MPGIGILSLILVCFSVQCVAYPVPQDPCKTGDDGITLKDCRRTTDVEKCSNETEWYDEKFDGVTVCCCSCHPGYLTHRDSGSLTCHPSPTKPSKEPVSTTTSTTHATPGKPYSETMSSDTSTAAVTVTPDPGTTPHPTPEESATLPTLNTPEPTVTSSKEEEPGTEISIGTIVGIVIGVIILVAAFILGIVLIACPKIRDELRRRVYYTSENGRTCGQNLRNGVEMGELGNGAGNQNEAHNDGEENGNITNQDAEVRRSLLGEDDAFNHHP